jgi:fructose-1-phosphate kinase PfkB-like protein
MIAGFIEATVSGMNIGQTLVRAVAFGSSACMMQGTLPPAKETVDKLCKQITLTKL